jgi:hypothetical protein
LSSRAVENSFAPAGMFHFLKDTDAAE